MYSGKLPDRNANFCSFTQTVDGGEVPPLLPEAVAYLGVHFGGINLAHIIHLPGRELVALAVLSL